MVSIYTTKFQHAWSSTQLQLGMLQFPPPWQLQMHQNQQLLAETLLAGQHELYNVEYIQQ